MFSAFVQANHIVLALLLGFLLDAIIGDPEGLYHPVRLIGKLISFFDSRLNRETFSDRRRFAAGLFTAVSVTVLTGAAAAFILWLCYKINFWLFFAVEAWMDFRILSVKSLSKAALGVEESLEAGNNETARYRVSMLVGRDTENLDAAGIARAGIETVAENTADGCIIPLFYLALFGPVGGWAYKAVSTMDSMIGYKNDRYLFFGRAAARFDDVLAFLPERLSAYSMILAAGLLPSKESPGRIRHRADGDASCFWGYDGRNAARIYHRDGRKSESPNSACCEAACAGALHIELGGPASYFGKPVEKPRLGDPDRLIENEDIRRACILSKVASVLALILFTLLRFLLACQTDTILYNFYH